MARSAARFVCQQCGASHARWGGRCESCGAWNSIVEEAPLTGPGRGRRTRRGPGLDFVALSGSRSEPARWTTGIAEFDRVTGGGLVAGSALLVAGDPGIGKSTLLLEVAGALAKRDVRSAYVSGEESVDQIRSRARRLGIADASVALAAATDAGAIAAGLDVPDGPQVVVVDSIQTMYVDALDSAPGTVAQVRASAQELVRLAKNRGFAVLLVGHVTKEGLIAGPKVLEHMVDTVLYFEGERSHQFRILRAVKNRFGPSDEIGVFEMTDGGLVEVENPSALFLSERGEGSQSVSGSAVFAGIEGTRPVLVEIQALVAPSGFATARRGVVGWDTGRLAMVLAVLEARCGFVLAGRDVYLNVAGGLRIAEPAADLAAAAALVSSLLDVALPPDSVVFGEIGLGGEVRAVGQVEARLREASKLGFTRAYLPPWRRARAPEAAPGIEGHEISRLSDLVAALKQPTAGKAWNAPRARARP